MRKTTVYALLVSVMSFCLIASWTGPASASAGEPEETSIVFELSKIALSVLGVALATLVTIYVPRLARAIERRLKVDIPDALEQEATRRALDALAYGEEWGRKKAKKAGEKFLSNDKLDAAAAYFRNHASKAVISWLGDRVEEWLEAKLGQQRQIAEQVPLIAPTSDLGPSVPGAR